MNKSQIVILGTIAALSVIILFQVKTAARLRGELAAVTEENSRLRQNQNLPAPEQDPSSSSLQAGSNAGDKPGEPQQKSFQELQSEVLRLRGATSRAIRAESEVAQLKSALESRKVSTAAAVPDANFSSSALLAYLGEAVPPPPGVDPAYSKEGLLNAVQQAAQLASVPLKKLEIETSEFPFLAGVVCESESDFEKLRAQFKNMPGYEYRSSSGNHGAVAFNITPYQNFPPESADRVDHRTILRLKMFLDQLGPHPP